MTRATTAVGSETARGHGRERRAYRHQGGKRILHELAFDDDEVLQGGTQIRSTVRLVLDKVRWNINAEQNRRRRSRQATASAIAPVTVLANEVPCDPEGCQPTDSTPPPPPPPASKNVVFLHGLGDTPDRWTRMRDWLRPLYRFGLERGPQLTASARPGQQANELTAYLQATGDTGFLAVGHSMGGLVARQVAQQRPDLVSGVLTVGTPHLGAVAALRAKPAIRVAFNDLGEFINSLCPPQHQELYCFIGDAIVRDLGDYLANYLVPPGAVTDLQPVQYVANPYIQGLNATPENFPRVGIVTVTAQRWVWARLLAESGGLSPDDPNGGRAWVRRVSKAFFVLQVGYVIAAASGHSSWANTFAAGWFAFDYVDFLWQWVTTAPQPSGYWSDGLVQTSSQTYPSATENFTIRPGDSHAGEPRSDKTRQAILDNLILERFFGVPPR